MNTKQLFSILTRKELTNIATELSNTDVKGLKIKTSSFINLIAKINGKSPEAFLSKIDNDKNDITSILNLRAIFDHTDGQSKIAMIGFDISTKGFSSPKVSVFDSIFTTEGFVRDLTLHITGSDQSYDHHLKLSKQELNDNLQVSINLGFKIVNEFNKNKESIKTEKDLLNIINQKWDIKHIGLKK